jgi:hypothetical protein
LPGTIRIIKEESMRWVGHVAQRGEKRNAYRILVGKPEGKKQLDRPRFRSMDLREKEWSGIDWIDLT